MDDEDRVGTGGSWAAVHKNREYESTPSAPYFEHFLSRFVSFLTEISRSLIVNPSTGLKINGWFDRRS